MTSSKSFLPVELQQQILCDLPGPALKSVRLACKLFNSLVEESLFRHLVLYPTTDSFEKLEHVCTHSRFADHVRFITYSGNMLLEDNRHKRLGLSFAAWRAEIGYGMNLTGSVANQIRENFSQAGLVGHYSAYLRCVEGQIAIRKGHKEKAWLKSVFRRLPNLAGLEYAAENTIYKHRKALDDLEGIKDFMPIAQATLMEANYHAGFAHTARQTMALFTAAHATGAKVTVFKANHVPWELFSQAPKKLHIMYEVAERLSVLLLKFRWYGGLEDLVADPRANLADFIGSASNLKTLELDLGGFTNWTSKVRLKGALETCAKGTGLKRLKLQRMVCREGTLRAILSNNADTLRSLELGSIVLLSDTVKVPERGPSWVSIVRFLRQTLKLNHLSLNGPLGNGMYENWSTHSIEQCTFWNNRQLYHGNESLHCRVERYILTGGECPLPGEDFCSDWTIDKEGDHSWYLEDSHVVDPNRLASNIAGWNIGYS